MYSCIIIQEISFIFLLFLFGFQQNGYVKSLKVMVNHGGDLNLLVNEMSALQVAKSLDLEEMNNFLEELGYKSHG